MKISILIDGRRVEVDRGTPVLAAARKAGIQMPTLCHHDLLKPYGSCRLCMVEIVQNKQRRLVTSCNFPVEGNMEVFTDTDKVRKIRRMILRLLLARCPEAPLLKTMARQMGVQTSGFKKTEDHDCILCGLCVRFCEEVVAVGAIGLANRGVNREVATPFKIASDVCIGCGSCTYICPTGCIEMLPDEKTPQLRRLKIGQRGYEPCPEKYQCDSCPADQDFINNFKRVIAEFRHASSD